MCLRLEVVYSC